MSGTPQRVTKFFSDVPNDPFGRTSRVSVELIEDKRVSIELRTPPYSDSADVIGLELKAANALYDLLTIILERDKHNG